MVIIRSYYKMKYNELEKRVKKNAILRAAGLK